MNEYDASKITWHKYPIARQAHDGNWIMIWDIVLVNEIKDKESIAKFESELSTEEITITAKVQEKNLKVIVETLRWSWEDDLIGYFKRIWEGVNDIIGEIETIQGDARDTWNPWFYRKHKTSE